MNKIFSKIRLLIIIGFLSILLIANSTLAAKKTWTGATNSDWSLGANWGGTVPAAGDKVTIPTGLTNYPIINNGSFNVKDVKIEGTGSLTIEAGGTLTLSGKLEFLASTATVTQTGGTLDVRDLKFTNGGTYNQSGSGSLLKISHDYKNNGGGTFNSTGGTIQFTGSGGGGPRFDSGTNQFYNVIIDNGVDPKFDKGAGGNIKVAGNFTNNNPNLNVKTATFTFNGTGDQTISSASTPANSLSTFGTLIIDKPSGTVTLLTDIGVENTFTPTAGTLIQDGFLFYVGGVDTPFPVELVLFTARISGNKIILNWLTATEVNNYGFEVERTTPFPPPYQGGGVRQLTDGGGWEKIGFVEGHGNSNSPKNYSFTDRGISYGVYAYRLKQIDNDGTYEYSDEIEVDAGKIPNDFVLEQNYPNPFNPSTIIRFAIIANVPASLKIYDVLGNEVEELFNEQTVAGKVYNLEFNAVNLPSGVYFYKLETPTKILYRKMLLIK